MLVRRPQIDDNKWKYWKDQELATRLCEMDVFATSSLLQSGRSKEVFLKLLPSTIIAKRRIVAVLCLYGYDPDDALKEQWNRECHEVGGDDEADWSDEFKSIDQDQHGDDLENDPEVVDCPFEMQKSGTGLNKLVRREENQSLWYARP